MKTGRGAIKVAVLALALFGSAAFPAAAASFRTIGTLTVDTWFDGSWRVSLEDVLLARLAPAFTVEVKAARDTMPGWYQTGFTLGPVVNFTEILYLELVYGLSIDSNVDFTHSAEANMTFETTLAAASLGVRADYFPARAYWYILPSAGGTFHPVAALGLLGKLFLSYDSAGALTGSFWGETSYAFTRWLTARAGFTVSYSGAFGYSIIGGVTLSFSETLSLKYGFSYLSDTVQYLDQPRTKRGIENLLVFDARL